MKISVPMPAYNAERFIAEAVESILNQTFRDFELIIVNDGSTDGTLAIAERYAAQDERVTVVSQPNGGISAARNRGLSVAKGEWIAVMDSDDVAMPDRFERQLDFLAKNPDLAVVSAYVQNIDDKGKLIAEYQSPLTDRQLVKEVVAQDGLLSFHHSAVLMRREVVQALGGYRGQFDMLEDCDLWNRIAEQGHGILIQPEYLLKYRLHPSSVSVDHARTLALKRRWLHDCLHHRRRGEPEPSWDAFLAKRSTRPWLSRLNEDRLDLGRILYKQAVSAYVQGKPLKMAANITGAVLLSPKQMIKRVWDRFLHPTAGGRLDDKQQRLDTSNLPHATQ